ncbi:MAG TPA: DUF5011 domain-containing protein [Cyclobacteriaceae bacterium]|nr:DUF5011 domain-containing protein [Cyclobacteriaceae bacterium]HMV10041.1 DUF5011 domain-containing protein [Cyclobacteriaceae bacterium]HMV89980.1 DUF5011 domain-containing protein [Cyclobacteriaceae bacterium]HMW99812.1 DUF5011 domain-containing protein [Cyclobacteriaceae bacterium]HMX50204.1 DUF5011 domain-containing protein [Cyclobacteriaceae bacterium]
MKHIVKIIFFSGLIAMASCENDESENIAKGVIRYPSIVLEGEDPLVIEAGGTFTDPGAKAFLGTDDITTELESESNVDANTPGVYQVTYTVSTTNELGQESTVTLNRTVSVTDGDVSGVDISGTYRRDGNPANALVTVTKIKNGVFQSDNLRGSATNQVVGRIYAIGNNNIVVPITNSVFGRLEGEGTIAGSNFSYTLTFLDPPNTGATNFRNFVKQ